MTFYDVSMKMLTANFRRYKLYFLCNVFSIVLFYSFAAILTNKTFMNRNIVDTVISSNIYAPSLFVGIFIVLFIPYSYNAFMKNRKYEYGILMTLGMSEKEVLLAMLIENCVIAVVSLIIVLLLGTVISFIFCFIVQHVIGISGLQWYFNLDSYRLTAALYGITILLTLGIGIFGFLKMQLTDLIKERFRAETRGKSMPGIFITGVVFVIASILIVVIEYRYGNSYLFLLSIVLMFTGIYMIMTHMERVEQYFLKKVPDYMKRHVLEASFIRQHYKSRSRIVVIAAWLVGFSIFFAGISVVMYPAFIDNAINYSPYDLVYSQIFKKNQVNDREIESLLSQNGVSVKNVKQVDYLRDSAFNLLPVSEVNKEFGCSYRIPEGKFLEVFQYDLNDGSEHEMISPKKIYYNCSDGKMELQSAGSDVKILFNKNPTFADYTLVLSDADFSRIASKCNECWTGIIKLYTFSDWKHSGKAIDAVQKCLLEKNEVEQSEQHIYYRASSRIEVWTTAKQSAEFLILLMFFIVALFCLAPDVMIHFKIKAESEEEQRMLWSLYSIGMTSEEMLGMIRNKNIYYYMPQVIIGLFIGVFYNYSYNQFYGYGWKAAGYTLVIGVVLAALQLVVVRRYSIKELSGFGI